MRPVSRLAATGVDLMGGVIAAFGRRLREVRREHGLSQEDLAPRAGDAHDLDQPAGAWRPRASHLDRSSDASRERHVAGLGVALTFAASACAPQGKP